MLHLALLAPKAIISCKTPPIPACRLARLPILLIKIVESATNACLLALSAQPQTIAHSAYQAIASLIQFARTRLQTAPPIVSLAVAKTALSVLSLTCSI